MTDDQVADFNRIANQVALAIGDAVIDMAEASDSEELDARGVFLAAVSGATTGALKVLDATHKATPFDDIEAVFDGVMRSMADIWGQLKGDPAATSARVQ